MSTREPGKTDTRTVEFKATIRCSVGPIGTGVTERLVTFDIGPDTPSMDRTVRRAIKGLRREGWQLSDGQVEAIVYRIRKYWDRLQEYNKIANIFDS